MQLCSLSSYFWTEGGGLYIVNWDRAKNENEKKTVKHLQEELLRDSRGNLFIHFRRQRPGKLSGGKSPGEERARRFFIDLMTEFELASHCIWYY